MLISDINRAGVDITANPVFGMATPRKAFSESPTGSSWVSEYQPDDLCVTIGKGPFSSLPDYVHDLRGFVED